ncbi:MAG: PDZ domain-containing protein [Acidobacteriota bacterium]
MSQPAALPAARRIVAAALIALGLFASAAVAHGPEHHDPPAPHPDLQVGPNCPDDPAELLAKMVTGQRDRGWVGIEMDMSKKPKKVVISHVVPDSPAERAGLRVGDRLAAINQIRFVEENHAALEAQHKKMMPGKTVTYTVERAGGQYDLPVALVPLPVSIRAQWVGMQMLKCYDGDFRDRLEAYDKSRKKAPRPPAPPSPSSPAPSARDNAPDR